ncbi:hypothetical protein ASPVEDRAFT_44276 [Aspergillus versicolor CBS 583.65]|uniref:Rieske domain-containing protein n=1 Tax=Aspergillus versicolor CBS 583.65 TaxID=1036611 RepID=A0A1L9PTB9_ASPVE|nr:uncharacterized protein ASPVEDRAFT_44276 [Aspergillus versicolor CBS 583.65]OJJ04743.1 hypothetical protein ASPVEDRAFT_44276 [Aspergillus versicolor CBS 583.65]
MENLFPALVAVLAGLAFLYRTRTSSTTPPKAIPSPPTPAEVEIVSKESDFPPDWLTSSQLFELERRAIFSKTWIPLTHKTHFPSPGSYHTYNLASIPILLIKGKDDKVRAFHNVCRHRAYAVATRESGTSTVLGCRYHGWSYNANGQLIRAPHFDGVEGFERGENGLFEVGVKVDGQGVVWVNLGSCDEKEDGSISINGKIGGGWRWIGGGKLDGAFNWKGALTPPDLEMVPGSFIQSLLQPKSESTHLFPNMFIVTIPRSGCWLSLSLIPVSERVTSVRYDVYGAANRKDERAQAVLATIEEKVKSRISNLETEYQSCLNTGSILPGLDLEHSDTQKQILSLLKAHAKLEKSRGAEIYPARREPRMNVKYQQAEQLCQELDCDASHKSLAW